MRIFTLHSGNSPLIISIPHAGTHVPPAIAATLNDAGLRLIDTDWHVDRLYAFALEMGATILKATHSRYVIDLNRSKVDDHLYPGQRKTGLCPVQTFYGEAIYQKGKEPTAEEIAARIETYWTPYHERLMIEIARVKALHGYALVYDAHSIKSEVPLLFDGVLPDLNLGTNRHESCAPVIANAAFHAAERTPYSSVLNGRFLGGYITREYGRPQEHVHALQMELAWKNYMDERTLAFDEAKAARLSEALHSVMTAFAGATARHYG